MPKLYFYDVGLALALMGVEDPDQIKIHPFRGALFENLVILEFLKQQLNRGKKPNIYFWRDNVGHEIDLLLETGPKLVPLEIKSGQTITGEFYKGLQYWHKITKTSGGYIVYAGQENRKESNGVQLISYNRIEIENL